MKTHLKLSILISIILLSTLSNASTPNERLLKRSISSYDKYISKAENKSCNIKTGKLKSCEREIKSLNKRYNKYPLEIKSNIDIEKLNIRHIELEKTLETLKSRYKTKKITDKYKNEISRLEKGICKKQKNYSGLESKLCEKALIGTQKLRSNLPKSIMGQPIVISLISRHDDLKNMPKYMLDDSISKNNELRSKINIQSDFRKEKEKIGYWSELEKGKKMEIGSIKYSTIMNNRINHYKNFSNNCKTKYKTFIAKHKDKNKICELTINHDKYLSQYTALAHQGLLNKETNRINRINSELKKNGYIEKQDYDNLINNKDNYYNKIKNNLLESHKKANIPTPSISELKKTINKTSKLFANAISNNDWEDNNIINVSKSIENRAKKRVTEMGMELVKIGRLDKPWTLIKNKLGIPLHKTANGWIMMKSSKDNFCRMQHTTYLKAFDGIKYADISNINIISAILPTHCK